MKNHAEIEKRITKWVNDLFYDIVETAQVREQKEELRIHLSERVTDYMAQGLDFEDALARAKDGLGDPDELTSGFERKRAVVLDEVEDDYGININFRISRIFMKLVPLSPFIYVILGITQGSWMPWLPMDLPTWWAWGWVIIPMAAIMSSGIGVYNIVALSPFIYVLLGIFFGWWAWGWMIIPISALLFDGRGSRKKKKKKKHIKVYGVGNIGERISHEVNESVQGAMQELRDDLNEEFGGRKN